MAKLTKQQNSNLPPRGKPYGYAKDLGVVHKGPTIARPMGPLGDPFKAPGKPLSSTSK